MNLESYAHDWERFKLYIEDKSRDRCIITNKNWYKLRDYHLGEFLKTLRFPFGWLFWVKFHHRKAYREIPHMSKYYGIYKERRMERFLNFVYEEDNEIG